jgi:hypothetical protein
MNFSEAKDEMKKLAGGKYHSIKYELTEYASGVLEADCYLYLDPRICVSAPTWESAILMMKQELGCLTVDPSEFPE